MMNIAIENAQDKDDWCKVLPGSPSKVTYEMIKKENNNPTAANIRLVFLVGALAFVSSVIIILLLNLRDMLNQLLLHETQWQLLSPLYR